MKNNLKIVVLLLIFLGCENRWNKPNEILPESTFVAYFADSLILNESRKLSGMNDSVWKNDLDSLRKFHNCTPKSIEASFNFYKKDLQSWESFYKNVTLRLEHLQQIKLIQESKIDTIN